MSDDVRITMPAMDWAHIERIPDWESEPSWRVERRCECGGKGHNQVWKESDDGTGGYTPCPNGGYDCSGWVVEDTG